MSYSTKKMLTDSNGDFIPQYYDPNTDNYLPLPNPTQITVNPNVTDVVLQNNASTIGNGTPLTVGGIKNVTLEVTGTASSQTTVFEAASTSGTYYPISGTRLSDYSVATQSTNLNELWAFDVTGLVNFRARITNLVGIYEVSTLNITSSVNTSGNVTVTLNGVTSSIPVSNGVKEVDTLTITSGATTGGNITITLNGVAQTVAVSTGDTAGSIGDKIRAASFSGWTVSGTSGSNVVTFTKTSTGAVSAPTFTDSGSTGAVASFSRTTLGVNPDAPTDVATKIRNTSFSGWATGGTGATVTFTASIAGTQIDGTYSAGATGATGTMTTTTQGSSPSLTVRGKGL